MEPVGLNRCQRRELHEIEAELLALDGVGRDLARRLHEPRAARVRAALTSVPPFVPVLLLTLSLGTGLAVAGARVRAGWALALCAVLWAGTLVLLLAFLAGLALRARALPGHQGRHGAEWSHRE